MITEEFKITGVTKAQYTELRRIQKWGAEFNARTRIKAFEQSLPDAQELLDAN